MLAIADTVCPLQLPYVIQDASHGGEQQQADW